MTEKIDPQKIHEEFMEALKRLAAKERETGTPEAERVGEETDETRKRRRREILDFRFKPREVKKHLDRFVIQQEDAKRVLATAVCDHYHHVRVCDEGAKCRNYMKQNIVMLGPTGVGKTYLIRCLAELVGVPFVKADATKFSETGYVGGDVEDLVRDLVHKADGDISLAQYGMIYLDEADKIAGAVNFQGRDVSGAGVQRGLLKIMEETEVPLRSPQDLQSQFQAVMEFQRKGKMTKPVVNTRHILFIVSGAFDALPGLIERRARAAQIGFSAARHEKKDPSFWLREVQTEDLVSYGLEPEFVGRLPVRVICDPLSEEDLYRILTASEESLLRQYEEAFRAYGIEIRFDEKALWEVAKLAVREKTGARGLVTVCEKIFRDLKYELPSSAVKQFTLTEEMVDSPAKALEALFEEDRREERRRILEEVRKFEAAFLAKNGIRIEFNESGCQAVVEKVRREEAEVPAVLDRVLSNYNYGLGLIQKKSPREKFILDREVVLSPNTVLDQWIKRSYENPSVA